MTEHTKDKLAAALRDVGLDSMADKAATGFYHDFMSPLATPELQLLNDLAAVVVHTSRHDVEAAKKILELQHRVVNGDFDATTEEGDAWAESAEGQETLGALMGKHP